jgi:hypothetical protein
VFGRSGFVQSLASRGHTERPSLIVRHNLAMPDDNE